MVDETQTIDNSDVGTLDVTEPAPAPLEPEPGPPPESPYDVLAGRNPRWANAEHSIIEVEVEFRGLGWQVFATMVSDFPTEPGMEHMQVIAEATLAGDYGPIAEFVPPTIEQQREWATPLNRMDFRTGMRAIGVTTTMVNDWIESIADPDHQDEMLITWEDGQLFYRLDTFVTELGAFAGKTPEQLDTVFKISV